MKIHTSMSVFSSPLVSSRIKYLCQNKILIPGAYSNIWSMEKTVVKQDIVDNWQLRCQLSKIQLLFGREKYLLVTFILREQPGSYSSSQVYQQWRQEIFSKNYLVLVLLML